MTPSSANRRRSRWLRGSLLAATVGLPWADPAAGADAAPLVPEAAAMATRLVIDDFNRPSVGDDISTWTRGAPGATIDVGLAPAERDGTDTSALRVAYRLDGDRRSRGGFRVALHGLDVQRFDHFEFWIRGDAAAGFPESVKIGFLRPSEDRPSLRESGSVVVDGLTGDWKRVLVPLNAMSGILAWRNLEEFMVTVDSNREGPLAGAFLVDDLAMVETGTRGPSTRDEVIPEEKTAWIANFPDRAEMTRALAQRLSGWPATLLAREPLPADDREFLMRVARDTWRGLSAFIDRDNGLPVDTVAFRENSGTVEPARVGDYTSPTNIGLYLMAIAAARDLGLIGPEDAVARFDRVLSTLETLETFNGFFFNFYDTTVLKRTSNFISTIDSAWLVAGLMVARVAEPAIADRVTRLIEPMDFSLLYDPAERLLSQGYYTNVRQPSEYHYGLFYTEARLASFIAIGMEDVPPDHWFALTRTLGPEDTWQSQLPMGRERRRFGEMEVVGGYYVLGPRRFVPSWGGSMFEALMPTLVIDEEKYAPESLGLNNRLHTEIQREYALETLGYPVWGLSPSASMEPAGYAEFGVAPLGSLGYGDGVVTPHASALALQTAPTEAIANLRRLAELYPIYGDFGYYDAVDPLAGRVAHTYLTLDQAMIFLAVANFLTDGIVQRTFAADPIAARALPILGKERFFD